MATLRQTILRAFPFLRQVKKAFVWKPTITAWQEAVSSEPPQTPRDHIRKLIIVPSDPYTLTGSRGDDAMIEALLSVVRSQTNALQIFIVTGSRDASEQAIHKGLKPLEIWAQAFKPKKVMEILKDVEPDALVVIGADVMDGYYNPYLPLHALMFADMASRLGAHALVLGFSFNRTPPPELKQAFDLTSPSVRINLRDEQALERFRAFSSHPAQLVADAAFCLKPASQCALEKEVKAWVGDTHKAGDMALAFNIHPMLFKNATQDQVNALIAAAANALDAVSKKRKVRWLFIPHDFREDVGDDACLEPLEQELASRGLSDRILRLDKSYSASELKAAAGQTDGVVTGRMHLAIGSLGMGLPVAALTYQDKFQGLFRHFDLPEWLLISPQELLRPGTLEAMILRFIDENAQLKQRVLDKLPGVMKLSQKNFEPLSSAARP